MSVGTKNVLITGGCGFIGSNFIRYFYHRHPEYRIFNLDLLTYAGNPDNLVDIEELELSSKMAEKRYNFIYGDICDSRLLDIIFRRHAFDLVINFAAETHVDRSIINTSNFIRTNIGGTHSLLEAVRTHQVPRIIHISTDEIYGSIPEGFSHEDTPLRPSNPYATSKAAADLIVQSFINTHKVPAVIVRGSNNYGPYQYPEKLIPLTVSNLIEGGKISIHGSGQHIRSWLHVEDFCSAIELVSERGALLNSYNVSGEERTNLEVVRLVAEQLNRPPDQHIEYINDRPGADARYAPDVSKLRQLGWERKHSFDESMKDVVTWYLTNHEWWRKIKNTREFLNHYEKQSKGQWY